jgi:DNA-binding NtrC family response regulator
MAGDARPLGVTSGPRPVRPAILVVDDDLGLRESFRLILEEDYEVLEAADGPRALEIVRSAQVDLVLLDIRLPDMDGIEVLERLKALDEQVEVILVTAVKTVRTAVAAMKLGAFDYVTKPFEEEELLSVIRRALERRALVREVVFLRSELARHHSHHEIVGQHPEIQRLHRLIAQVARTPTTVLITGESGTGKELVARAIHWQSPRRDRPFVAVNPAAIADTLIESDLFGHEKGAFTGAYQRKLGRFELAQGGTLFLDEIATLKPELQAKLLRVLQEREIERVGGTRAVKIDVRIIAATNVDLQKVVSTHAFREDLFYRLAVVTLAVPPLRERRDDIPLLVDHFIRRFSREFTKQTTGMAPAALELVKKYPWPGNVRELQNVVERSVVLGDGPTVGVDDLPLDVVLARPRPGHQLPEGEPAPLLQATDDYERQLVLRALDQTRWNYTEAARLLGVHRNTLKGKLTRWDLLVPRRAE